VIFFHAPLPCREKLPLVAIALLFAWRARHRWELATLLVVIAAASVVVSLPPPR
jgi:hypothetical protein